LLLRAFYSFFPLSIVYFPPLATEYALFSFLLYASRGVEGMREGEEKKIADSAQACQGRNSGKKCALYALNPLSIPEGQLPKVIQRLFSR
jgi:hypothetical protein